jgi:hypothetical protein
MRDVRKVDGDAISLLNSIALKRFAETVGESMEFAKCDFVVGIVYGHILRVALCSIQQSTS